MGNIITDRYTTPQSWDDLDSEWIENGDYAGWVDAIRSAMMERVVVCLDGFWGGRELQSLVNGLGYFQRGTSSNNPHGYRGDCEVYEFAKETEIILDCLLTPHDEFGTADNELYPDSEDGYFVDKDPSRWMKRTTYADDSSDTGSSTTVYVKYLNMERMFEDPERNYKLALNGVARGDMQEKFVPFFNAVKNALNFMTVVPIATRGVKFTAGSWPNGNTDISIVEADATADYNAALQGQPNPSYLYNYGRDGSLQYFSRLINYGDPDQPTDPNYYTARVLIDYEYPLMIRQNSPYCSCNLYRGYWAEKISGYDNFEFAWGSEYTPEHELIGQIDGVGHFLGGDNGKHFGNRFPSKGIEFPTTPAKGQTIVRGFNMHLYHFADFGIEGGFKFRDSGA